MSVPSGSNSGIGPDEGAIEEATIDSLTVSTGESSPESSLFFAFWSVRPRLWGRVIGVGVVLSSAAVQ